MKRPFSLPNPRMLPDAAAIMATREHPEGVVDQARGLAPVVWLVGKVQSGKTSIVGAITQNSDAEVGTGFKACTRTARERHKTTQRP